MSTEVTLSFASNYSAHALRKENEEFIDRWTIEQIPCSNKERYKAAIYFGNKVVGEVSFRNFERELTDRECIVSYWVDRKHWGKGIGTAALKLALDYALQEFDVDVVIAFIHEFNVASIGVAKKAGMKLVGVRRISMYNGGSVDLHLKYSYGNL